MTQHLSGTECEIDDNKEEDEDSPGKDMGMEKISKNMTDHMKLSMPEC